MRSKIGKVLSFLMITILSFVVIGFYRVYAKGDIDLSIDSKFLYNDLIN